MTACRGSAQFQLTGPGVNMTTTLSAGCEADYVTTLTLQPAATYVAQDLNKQTAAHASSSAHNVTQLSVAHATFTTLSAGGPGTVAASSGSTASGKGTPNQSVFG